MMKTAQTTKTKLREKHDRAKLHSSLQLDPHSRTGRFRSGFERHVAIDLKFEFKLRIPGSIAISSSFPRRSTPALRSLRFSAPIRWERFKKNAPTKKKLVLLLSAGTNTACKFCSSRISCIPLHSRGARVILFPPRPEPTTARAWLPPRYCAFPAYSLSCPFDWCASSCSPMVKGAKHAFWNTCPLYSMRKKKGWKWLSKIYKHCYQWLVFRVAKRSQGP